MSDFKNKTYIETSDEAMQILDEYGLEYEHKNYALYIQHPTKEYKAYDYRYTTQRWANLVNRRNRNRKHYYCKGTRDLIERFILNES